MLNKIIILGLLLFIPVIAICDVNNFCPINESENLTLWVWNASNGNYSTSYTAYVNIYKQGLQITNNVSMTIIGDGMAYYTLNNDEINSTGLYEYQIISYYDSTSELLSDSYEIVDNKPLNILIDSNSTIQDINNTISDPDSNLYSNIWEYTTRTITALETSVYNTIAQFVWDYSDKSIDSVPVITTVTDRGGTERTVIQQIEDAISRQDTRGGRPR